MLDRATAPGGLHGYTGSRRYILENLRHRKRARNAGDRAVSRRRFEALSDGFGKRMGRRAEPRVPPGSSKVKAKPPADVREAVAHYSGKLLVRDARMDYIVGGPRT